MKGAVAVMVKTPELSPVKTRLAEGVGPRAAEAFYLASLAAVVAVMRQTARETDITPYFAVAEASGMTAPRWRTLDRILQGEGGLGRRLHRVYASLRARHRFVVLLGADAPQIEPDHLISASRWLTGSPEPRFAFAPAEDGGFWLFGGNRPLPSSFWTDVAYSRPDTGFRIREQAATLGAVLELPSLTDVDRPEDLSSLRQAIADMRQRLPEQEALLRYLETLL